MQSKATTVAQYLSSLPADRRAAIEAVRKAILANIDRPFEEGMQYGMIGYCLPHSVYPAGYHCDPKQPLPFAGLASQKNHMSLYLFCIYGGGEHERWFREAWERSGKKLDMGKGCVRFKKLEDVPLDVVGGLMKRVKAKEFVAHYEAMLEQTGTKRKPADTGKGGAKGRTGKQTAKQAAARSSGGERAPAKTPAARRATAKASTASKATAKTSSSKRSTAKKPASRR